MYGGILADGRRVGSTETQLRNGLYLMLAAFKTKSPYKIFRKGIGMLVQIFTRMGRRPEQLRPRNKGASRPENVFGPTHQPLT